MVISGFTRMFAISAILVSSTAMGAAPLGSTPTAVDVALAQGGVMRGRLVDPSGTPLAGQPISLLYEGRVIAQSTTDHEGDFSVAGLRGGSHALAASGNSLICRLWTGNAAPPSAQASVLMVSPGVAVRGQGCKHCGTGEGGLGGYEASGCNCGECESVAGIHGRGHYLLQPRALILYAGLAAVVWQASEGGVASSPSL